MSADINEGKVLTQLPKYSSKKQQEKSNSDLNGTSGGKRQLASYKQKQ